MNSFYLAGSYAARDMLRAYRDTLNDADIPVTATWLTSDDQPDNLALWAVIDQMDIDACTTFVLFTDTPSTTGGMWFEYGLAFARGKRIVGVGPKTNLFCHGVGEWFTDFDELLAALTSEREAA